MKLHPNAARVFVRIDHVNGRSLPPDRGPLSSHSPPSHQLEQRHPSETLHFIDQREVYYFRTYQEEAASELSGLLKSSVWGYALLQSCYQEPFVLRAVVALGALNRSMKTARLAAISDSATREEKMGLAQQHQAFALASYDRAIVDMQKVVPKDAASLRKALLSCLLIFCVENFLKSPNTGTLQAQTGYRLLHDWIITKPQRKLGLASPDSSYIEDEIFHELAHLDIQHAIRWGIKELPRHSLRRLEGTATIQTMPTRFGHLDEARVYHALLLRRTHHLIGEIYARIMAANQDLRHPFTSTNPGEFVDPCLVPQDLLPEIKLYLSNLHLFASAYLPLLKKLLASPDTLISCGAALFRINTLNAEICLAGSIFTAECSFDTYNASLIEIVILARHITTLTSRIWSSKQPIFTFADGMERPLTNVAMYCRLRPVRLEALSLLRSTAHRDPTGNQARMATQAAFLVSLKEEGRLPDGSIPEENRWRLIWNLIHYFDEKRHLTLLCCRRVGFPVGKAYPAKWEWRRRTFEEEEVEVMGVGFGEWREEMHWEKWPPRSASLPKPKCLAWREVLGEISGTGRSRYG